MASDVYSEPKSFRPDGAGAIPVAARDAISQDGVVCIREAIPAEWLEIIGHPSTYIAG